MAHNGFVTFQYWTYVPLEHHKARHDDTRASYQGDGSYDGNHQTYNTTENI